MQIGRVTAPAPTGHRGHPWLHAWLRANMLALALIAVLAAGPLPGAAAPAPGGSPPGAPAPSGEGVLLRLALREGETRRYAVTLDLSGVVEEQGFESAGGRPLGPPEVDRFAVQLRLDTTLRVLTVLPDGSADVLTTVDAVSLTVDGEPLPLPLLPGPSGRALPLRLLPDGSFRLTDATIDALDPDAPPPASLPGLPGLSALPGLPPPALLLTLPGLPSPALAFLPYPGRPLRLGETLADEVRLTESEFRFSALLDGALQRRTTLTEAPAGAGRGAVRLTTRVLVPVGGRFDGPGLTLRGTVEAQVTQDVDRATGWPRAAEGVLRVAGVLTEDAPDERTTAEVELRLTLRER